MSLQDIKKSKKPRTKGYFERKSDQKKAVQDYFKNKNKKETTDRAPGSEGYKPTKTDIGPKMSVDKGATGSKTFKQSFSEARKGGQKEFTWNGKKYNTKLASDTKPAKVDYQDANPNKSNAPNPFKKNDSDNKPVPKSDDDKMKWAQGAMESAQGLLRRPTSMKKGGKVYCKDGCAVRGKTKGRII